MTAVTAARKEIEAKVAANVVERALTLFRISQHDLAKILSVSPRTIQRWHLQNGAPQPETRRELEDLQRLLFLIVRSIPEDEIPLWSRTPNEYLKGKAPLQIMREGNLREVLAFVAAVDSGAFL